jgi:hypothetical protein
MVQALAEFEAPFTYPLGPDKFFQITHGEDYTLFFRAQGDAACFVAEQEGCVIGSLGTVIRRLWMPDNAEHSVAYLGDLKIATCARRGLVLARLAQAAEAWLRPRVNAAFGVVMGGTAATPETYTNRAGIPGFQEVGRLTVLRASNLAGDQCGNDQTLVSTNEAGLACYRQFSRSRYACPVGRPELRSKIPPTWLINPDGSACGLLEDTRKAKRLIINDGTELLSAHISCFSYATVSAGAQLLRGALQRAAQSGLPGLFVALPEPDAKAMSVALANVGGLAVLPAPAIVYGTGLEPGTWNINSAEI